MDITSILIIVLVFLLIIFTALLIFRGCKCEKTGGFRKIDTEIPRPTIFDDHTPDNIAQQEDVSVSGGGSVIGGGLDKYNIAGFDTKNITITMDGKRIPIPVKDVSVIDNFKGFTKSNDILNSRSLLFTKTDEIPTSIEQSSVRDVMAILSNAPKTPYTLLQNKPIKTTMKEKNGYVRPDLLRFATSIKGDTIRGISEVEGTPGVFSRLFG